MSSKLFMVASISLTAQPKCAMLANGNPGFILASIFGSEKVLEGISLLLPPETTEFLRVLFSRGLIYLSVTHAEQQIKSKAFRSRSIRHVRYTLAASS